MLCGTYLPISPIDHVLDGQSGPVNRRGLPPYWESQEDNHGPECSNDLGAGLDGGWFLGRRRSLDGVGSHCRCVGGDLGRLKAFWFRGHGHDILVCMYNRWWFMLGGGSGGNAELEVSLAQRALRSTQRTTQRTVQLHGLP